MGLIGDSRFVLLGEASHGTHDFAVSIWPVCLNGNGGERPFLDQPFRDLRTGVVGVRSRARKQLVCCLSLPRKPTDADSVVKAIGSVTDDLQLGVLVKKMPTRHTIANLTSSRGRVMQWFLHLGGLGLIPLGLLDGSFVPILPGSMDIATILLAAHDKELWFYYAAMATAGSVLGGFLAYRLARKGGKEALDKKLGSENVQKIYERFERWGFAAIVVFALLPPPMPLFPVELAAGATRYSVTKFLTALTLGRAVRFTVLAFVAARYGAQILTVISHHEYVILLAMVGLAVLGFVLFYLVRKAKLKTRTG